MGTSFPSRNSASPSLPLWAFQENETDEIAALDRVLLYAEQEERETAQLLVELLLIQVTLSRT